MKMISIVFIIYFLVLAGWINIPSVAAVASAPSDDFVDTIGLRGNGMTTIYSDLDEAGNCVSTTCKAAETTFWEFINSTNQAPIYKNDTTLHERRLNPLITTDIGPNTYFEDPTSLFSECLDDDIQMDAVATSSGNWGRPTQAWLPSVANNGRYECNEYFCYSYDEWPSWFECPADENDEVIGGENFHYIDAGPGNSTGKWFQLEWSEMKFLCQIWIDTKGFVDRYPCGRDKRQTAPNRVLNADIQYWDESKQDWVTVGSKMDATDDWVSFCLFVFILLKSLVTTGDPTRTSFSVYLNRVLFSLNVCFQVNCVCIMLVPESILHFKLAILFSMN
jgi:hypothetical protein